MRKAAFSRVLLVSSLIVLSIPMTVRSANQTVVREFPTKTIRLIVPYSPGGNADYVARELARRLTEVWKVQVVVDNRAGAGSLLGLGLTAAATPDGYTLGLATSAGLAIAPALGIKMPFDPLKSFTPIGLAVYAPFAMAVNGALPVLSVTEFVALAKSKPGQLSYASPGTGTPNHLGGEMLKVLTGINIVHVPYKGSGPALVDLLAGEVQMMFAGVPQVLPYMKSGKLRVIAVGHPSRLKVLPEVPTVAETIPGFDNSSWFGLVAPAGLARTTTETLNGALNSVFGSQEVVQRLLAVGVESAPTTPQEFESMIRNEYLRWQKVVREAGIKVGEPQ